jgi:UrcA family protein
LERKYPIPAEGDTTRKCIDDAVAGAMVDARKAVDAAKQGAPASYVAAVPAIQKGEGVTVEAVRGGRRSDLGAPIETVRTTRVVSYADISLTTQSGTAVLETRIRDAARSACTELEQKYPIAAEGDTPKKCFDDAVAKAMADAGKAVDSAKYASDSD